MSGARPPAGWPGASGAPGARPSAPQPSRPIAPPPAAPAPSSRRDPFGLGVSARAPAPPPAAVPVAAPAPAPEDDWGGLDFGAPETPAPTARLELTSFEEEMSLEVEEPEAGAAGPSPIELPPAAEGEPELAPMHAFVPPAADTGHQPAPAVAADAGEAALREALSQASREVIERVVWEVVPQLAETIIRENLDRLVKNRQDD